MTDIWLCPVPHNSDILLCPIGPHVTPTPSLPTSLVLPKGMIEGTGSRGGFATTPQYWYADEEKTDPIVWPDPAIEEARKAAEMRRKRRVRRRAESIAIAMLMLGD